MATEIPRVFLAGVSSSSAAAQTVNQKKWKHEQVRQALVLNNDHKCHYYMLNNNNNNMVEFLFLSGRIDLWNRRCAVQQPGWVSEELY